MPSTGSTTPTRLTTNNAVDSNPVLSPDGSKIAYVSNANGAENIYVVNVSGGSATQLTTLFGNSNPSWSTDGTKITFQSNRDGNLEIYSMDAATGNNQNNQVRLTNNAFVDSSPKYGTVQEVVVTVPTINYVADLVTYLLSIGYDPIHYIGLNNITNNFVVENPTNIPFPAAPTNPTATSSDSISASFTWNYAPWAETYQVFRDGNFVAEVDRDTNIFNFTGMNNLIGNTSYIFGVKTVNGVGVSTLTATATLLTRPGMPTASVANVMLTSATLNWTAPTGGAVNYNIYRVVSGVSTLVATVPGTTNPLTYNITGLSPNTIYTYSVSGSNASGESAKSSVTFTTPNTNTGGIIGNPIPNPV